MEHKRSNPKLPALARQFIRKQLMQHDADIVLDNDDTQSLLEKLLVRIGNTNKEERSLARHLKGLKSLLSDQNRDYNGTEFEEKLRDVLLKCGMDASCLDDSTSVTANAAIQPHDPLDLDAEKIKEEGNKCFTAKDYKKALSYYSKALSLSGIPNDLFIKIASNQALVLVEWDGATETQVREALTSIEAAMKMDCTNVKLLYRASQLHEWLDDLQLALLFADVAHKIDPESKEIKLRRSNLRHSIAHRQRVEHLDEYYRTKSESESIEQLKTVLVGISVEDLESHVSGVDALVLQAHRERDFNKNYVAAAKYYELAADAGSPEGYLNLASLYLNGLGVKQNTHKAFELLQKAVQCHPSRYGVIGSYAMMGLMYYTGVAVEEDKKQSKLWFQKAADLGNLEGELNLGYILHEEEDYLKAFDMYQSAAIKGYARAYYNLGGMYKYGQGIKTNFHKARLMYNKAIYHGLSVNVEWELKLADPRNLLPSKEKDKWHEARMNNFYFLKIVVTTAMVDDLKVRSKSSVTAWELLTGWEDYKLAMKMIQEKSTNSRQMLKLFSSAIRRCYHILEIDSNKLWYLRDALLTAIASNTPQNEFDYVICGSYMRLSPKILDQLGFDYCSHVMGWTALNFKGPMALFFINNAIEIDPKNVELLFYKALITDRSEHYLKFLEKAPLDHYWRPRAFYSIAEEHMQKNQVAEVFKCYEMGLEAEKLQLLMFRDVEISEKNEVADYLISEKKLYRHPSRLKVNQHRRKELLTHHHNQFKKHVKMPKPSYYVVNTTLPQRPQPDPTEVSRRQEFFLEDLDLSKEHVYEGYIDCLIIAPPFKSFGVTAIVEDKKGITSRVLLYDISLVHIKVGQWIRLFNPYVRIAQDLRSALKVNNPKCFEVLHYEKICHCCTREFSITESLPIACSHCRAAFYCSADCCNKHFEEFQHQLVCKSLLLNDGK